MSEPNFSEELSNVSSAVELYLEEAARRQLSGQLPEAAEAIEKAIRQNTAEGSGPNLRVTLARSYLAGILDEIGLSVRALEEVGLAMREWKALADAPCSFGLAFCAQTQTSALRKLGKLEPALQTGQLAFKFYRAWLGRRDDLEQAAGSDDLGPEDSLELIRKATFAAPRASLGFNDLGAMVAVSLVRHCRTISHIYIDKTNFTDSQEWLHVMYRAAGYFYRQQKLVVLAEAGQGYETLLIGASEVKQIDASSEEADRIKTLISLASSRVEEISAALDRLGRAMVMEESPVSTANDEILGAEKPRGLDSMVRKALDEANRLFQTGEISSCLIQLTNAIDLHEAKHSKAFCLEIALAKIRAGVVLAEQHEPERALAVLESAYLNWQSYEGEDRLFYYACVFMPQAFALLQLGKHEEAIAKSQDVLKMLSGWLLSQTDPQLALQQPDLRADEAAEILWKSVSQTESWRPEISAEIFVLLVHACVAIARAQILTGRLLPALPWLDFLYEELDSFTEPQKATVRVALSVGYNDFATSAIAHARDEQWRTQLNSPVTETAFDRWEKLSDSIGLMMGSQHGEMGFMAQLQDAAEKDKSPQKAYAQLIEMLAELDDGKHTRERAIVLLQLGKLETDRHRPEEAITRLGEAMSLIANDPSGDLLRASCHLEVGRAHLEQQDFAGSLRWGCLSLCELRQAYGSEFTNDERASLVMGISSQMLLIGKALHGLGNNSGAIFCTKLALAYGSLAIDKTLERLASQFARSAREMHCEVLGEALAEWLVEEKRLGEAIALTNMKNIGTSVAVQVPPRFEGDTEADRVSMTPAECEGVSQFVSGLEALWQSSAEKVQALVESVAEKLRTTQTTESDESSVFDRQQLSRFMDTLPREASTAYLRYTPLKDRLQIVVVTSQGTEARSAQISAGKLAKTVFKFLECLTSENNYSIESLAQDLYDQLIAPVRDMLEQIQARRLIIDARDFLRFVPFSALHDGERYLVEHFSCVSWESAVAGVLKQHPSPQPRVTLLGRLTGDDERDIAALPSVQDEAMHIMASCRDGKHALLQGPPKLDDSFTAAALQEALANSDIVHISTHFYNNPADHRGSRLVLGGGELLGLDDLAALTNGQAAPDLVTLSACSTGVPAAGAESAQESSPASVLHALGVCSVVTTLWPIVSASTAQLMDIFYRGLIGRKCTDKAEALRIAQLSLLHGTTGLSLDSDHDLTGFGVSDYEQEDRPAEAPNYSHPYFWAPFVLSGNWLPFFR